MKPKEDMTSEKNILIYIISLYLAGTALYTILTVSWTGPTDLLAKVIIFQSFKLAAGVTLFFKAFLAPYLMAIVLLWSVVVTGLGFNAHPLAEQTGSTISYVVINILVLLFIVLYSFYPKRIGYFTDNINA